MKLHEVAAHCQEAEQQEDANSSEAREACGTDGGGAGGGLIPTSSMREGGRSQASPSTRDVSTPPSRVSGSRQLEESTDSPLVQRGLLLNVSTGRAIKIGGPTFHSLQDKVPT